MKIHRRSTGYALSLPERIVRSLSGLLAGTARELGDVMLPARVRRSRLYSAVVGATLRFLIEQVAEIQNGELNEPLPPDFLLRRVAGNIVELAGIAAFHASPVWVLAALSDLAGAGRDLITEMAEALQQAELLPRDNHFSSVNELLDGLERTTGQMAQTVNTPPLNVAAMREEWHKICKEAIRIPRAALPDSKQLRAQWEELKREAARQERSVLELSSLLAITAVRALPENARWLSRAARVTGKRTGDVVAHALLEHYQVTLKEIQSTGYARYWLRELQPYLKGAARQFSLQRLSTTERLLQRAWRYKGTPS